MSVCSEEEGMIPNEEQKMEIDIQMDKEAYFVGQEVTGRVLINNQHNRKMRGVRLTLKCRGEVLWWDKKKNSRVKNINDYTFHHKEQYIAGDGKTTILKAGFHVFPFTVPLVDAKTNLPSSMEFPNGNVRYTVTAEVDWPWAQIQSRERLLNVSSICNLRNHKDALQPASFTYSTKVGVPRKAINISGKLEKIAYVPGEEILLHVEINNNSGKKLPNCWIQLTEIVRYFSSDGKHCDTRHYLVTNEYGPVAAKDDLILEMEPIVIPPCAQSGQDNSETLLKLKYEVSIIVQIGSKMHAAAHEIFIGTLPTKNSYQRFYKDPLPPSHVLDWPFGEIKGLPTAQLKTAIANPDIDYDCITRIDEKYRPSYMVFRFNREKALNLIRDEVDESSDDECQFEDNEDAASVFSL